MAEVIAWCNVNVGFVSLVLSAFTLLVSIIAILVSLHTARLPYKKKVMVKTGTYISANGSGLHITATNVGNRSIKIKTIGFLVNDYLYINQKTIFDSQIILAQGETTSQYFDEDELKRTLIRLGVSPKTKIKAYVEDTEDTKYKKKLMKAEKMLK